MFKNKWLTKYKLKISLIFSISIFIVLLIAELVFVWEKYLHEKTTIEDKLITKYNAVTTIIKNEAYYKQHSEDETLKKLIEKWFKNSFIIKNNKINDNFPEEINQDIKNKILSSKIINYYVNLDGFVIYINSFENTKIAVIENKTYSEKEFVEELILFIFIDFLIFVISFSILYVFLRKILKKIEENVENLNEFTKNVNHELKTPITIIKSSLELYKKQNWENENINDALNATQNINTSLDAMMQMAIYNKWMSYEKQDINIKKEVKKIIKIYKNDIKSKKLNINIKVVWNNIVFVLKDHFLTCISNLIKNAIKFSNKNWKINIIIKDNSIIIKDHWIWIEEKNLEKIFSRLYKANFSNGQWIWLSIVKKIVDKNKWDIKVSSKKGKWSSFEIVF